MSIPERLIKLRTKMQQMGIDAVLIPSSDPHQSEYVASHWQSRIWISGFTGSAGTVVVTQDQAGVWTDGRYFLQAEEQLAGSGFTLQKVHDRTKPSYMNWIREQLPVGGTVSVDGRQISAGQFRRYVRILKAKKITLQSDMHLMDTVWENRPALPLNPIFEHAVKYVGKSREEKLTELRQHMGDLRVSHYLLTGLDDIAWLFNLRGKDVECNPVFYAYGVVTKESALLFIKDKKVPAAVRQNLQNAGIELRDYDAIQEYCSTLQTQGILLQPGMTNTSLYEALPADKIIEGPNIVRHLKAIKNETEIEHLREVMRKDGVALLRLYRWLDQQLDNNISITEDQVATRLDQFRAEQEGYVGESFNAIVGHKGNGAIIHYRPMPGSSATINKEGVLLIDSGGQYIDGTTDVTRTTALGPFGEKAKKAYTLVLKGHITLANIQFPEGTNGAQLDILARMHLWNQGLNYGHGTGHGVGFFLNVHEPPQGFVASTASVNGQTPFKVGMYTSNEPGYYETGEFGIRIENMVLCVPAQETSSGTFLKFDTITLFPISWDLIDMDLMEASEVQWMNDYHAKVYEELSPRLNEEERAWLEEKCRRV